MLIDTLGHAADPRRELRLLELRDVADPRAALAQGQLELARPVAVGGQHADPGHHHSPAHRGTPIPDTTPEQTMVPSSRAISTSA